MGVVAHPPAAEDKLHEEYAHTYKETGSGANMQIKSPVIEQHWANNTLADIVGQAHAAVRGNAH